MASLALGVVGAVVGSFFGAPQLGFALGSALGSALFPPPGVDGPRLTDLRVQNSSYGAPIPIVYGKYRVAGNMIWAAPLVEHPHQEDSGSGGGGATSYTYTCSFAVSLSVGPILGVNRIWADGKLVYNAGVTTLHAASTRLYLGDEEQLPDPTIEAIKGVGNVPGYRGQAYYVFTDLELGKFGNRVPNFTFEVLAAHGTGVRTEEPTYLGVSAAVQSSIAGGIQALVDPTTGLIWSMTPSFLTNQLDVRVNSDATQTQVASFTVPTQFNSIDTLIYVPGAPNQIWAIGEEFGTFTDHILIFNADSPSYLTTIVGLGHGTADITSAVYNPTNQEVIAARYGGGVSLYDAITRTAPLLSEFNIGDGFGSLGTIWVTKILLTPTYYAAFYYGSNVGVILRRRDTHAFHAHYACNSIQLNAAIYDPDHDRIIITHSEDSSFPLSFQVIDIAAGTLTDHAIVDSGGSAARASPSMRTVTYAGGKYIFGADASPSLSGPTYSTTLYIVDPTTFTTEHTYTYEPLGAADYRLLIDPLLTPIGNKPYVFSFDEGHVKRLYIAGEITGVIHLWEVVQDISLRAGLFTPQLDVTALTDLVDGYCVTSNMAARSAIEPLATCYFFDSVESDGKMKFVKRGAVPNLSINTTSVLAD